MSDMREFHTPAVEPTSSRSKLLAAGLVALGVAAGGAYAYFAPASQVSQAPQKVAMNEPVALTPPAHPSEGQTPSNQPALPEATPQPKPEIESKVEAPAERVARVKSPEPAVTSNSTPEPAQVETAPVPATSPPAPMSSTATPGANPPASETPTPQPQSEQQNPQ